MIKKIITSLLFFLFISASFADIPTDANGHNLEVPTNFNYLPLTLGILFAIGSTIAYFTYKSQKNEI